MIEIEIYFNKFNLFDTKKKKIFNDDQKGPITLANLANLLALSAPSTLYCPPHFRLVYSKSVWFRQCWQLNLEDMGDLFVWRIWAHVHNLASHFSFACVFALLQFVIWLCLLHPCSLLHTALSLIWILSLLALQCQPYPHFYSSLEYLAG